MTIREIKEKHEDDLLERENVIAVWSGKKEVNGEETDEDAVVVGVIEKKSKSFLDLKDVVPENLGDVKTDVQEIGEVTAPPAGEESRLEKIKSFFSLGKDRKSHWDEFPLGVSCAEKSVSAGTTGWILVDTEEGDEFTVSANEILEEDKEFPSSNNHVYAACDKAEIGSDCLQPGPYDDGTLPGDKNGNLAGKVKLKDGVKVDVAWIDPSRNYKNKLLEVATPGGPIHQVENGDVLIKSGRTTGVTQGTVKGAHATVRVRYPIGTIRREDVIITGKMLEGGDSGDAAIVNKDGKYQPAATGFAGSNRTSVFDRIENVVRETGMKIKVGQNDGDDGDGDEPEPPGKPEARVTLTLEKKEEEPDKGRIIVHVEEKETEDPISQAHVEIEGPSTGVGKTGGGGNVVFNSILIGDYTITAEKDGYKSDQAEISEDDFEEGKEGRVDARKIIDVDLPSGWKWYEDPQGDETSADRYASTEGGVGIPNLTVQCSSFKTREKAIEVFREYKKTGLPPGFKKEKEQFIGERSVMWTNRRTKTATILMQYSKFVIVRIPFQVNHTSMDEARETAETYAKKELSNMKKHISTLNEEIAESEIVLFAHPEFSEDRQEWKRE